MISSVIRPGHIRFAGPPMGHSKSGDGTMTVIPEKRLVVVIDRFGMRLWKIRQDAAGEAWLEELGIPFSKASNTAAPWWPSFTAGSAFDGERFVMWSGGREVRTARPLSWAEADLASGANWEIESFTNLDGPASNPDTSKSAGVFGKFHYLADYGVFVGYNNFREGAWFYKLPKEAPPDPRRAELEAEGFICADIVWGWGCPSLQTMVNETPEGGTLVLPKGVYGQCASINAGITIDGNGSVLDGVTCGGKAALIANADWITIANLECRNIRVSDGNGSCVRRQAPNLTLTNIYFHDNQEGVLGGVEGGTVLIENSRFERNGYGGKAHGIYIGAGDELRIVDTVFLCSVGEGHEVKTGTRVTFIENSVIDNQGCVDSRLVDVFSAGELVITDSVFAQRPGTSNLDMIGFGKSNPEKWIDGLRRIEITGSEFMCEAPGSRILAITDGLAPEIVWTNNTTTGDCNNLP